jgi:hypothetical protein
MSMRKLSLVLLGAITLSGCFNESSCFSQTQTGPTVVVPTPAPSPSTSPSPGVSPSPGTGTGFCQVPSATVARVGIRVTGGVRANGAPIPADTVKDYRVGDKPNLDFTPKDAANQPVLCHWSLEAKATGNCTLRSGGAFDFTPSLEFLAGAGTCTITGTVNGAAGTLALESLG